MSRARPIGIGIAVVVVAALIYFWWTSTYERVWYDRPLPLEGEATYNDFFVVQQALRAQGVRVESMPHLQGVRHWSDRDGLLLGSDAVTLSPAQVDELLDWVAGGGRLLVATGTMRQGLGAAILARIGVIPTNEYPCFQFPGKDASPQPDCFAAFRLRASDRQAFRVAIGSEKQGWVLARRDWGRGQIEVVGNLSPLHMNYGGFLPKELANARDHAAAWNWQMLSPLLQGGVFHIVYQSELPPLYVYLLRYGWYALLPLLVALLGWLWAHSQRFGPAMAAPAPDRRALGEHIQASGEYLYRRGLVDALYAPLRRRFDEQLRRRDPELAALPEPDIARVVAQNQRLPLEAVQQAMRPPRPRQHKAFLSSVKTLLHLIRHL